jgi:nicotinamide mononucleotide transporter|tara:strand:+ start:161 stop:838 length:678 start_codon:yes stop_codon:yes gene_type:complete
MSDLFASFSNVLSLGLAQALQSSALEAVAVVFAVAYLLLAVKENSWCWAAAIVSSAIYLLIFWDVNLYMESGLQCFYIGMAFFGLKQWQVAGTGPPKAVSHNTRATQQPLSTRPVQRWPLKSHLVVLLSIILLSLLSGYLLDSGTNARLPYIDAFTTWASIITTYMVAKKVLENWIYWLVIDLVSIVLYLDRELYFTAALFGIYIVIIFFGWFAWLKSYQKTISS